MQPITQTRGGLRWFAGVGAVIGLLGSTALAANADGADISAALTPEGGHITVEAHGVRPAVPVFFTAHVDQTTQIGPDDLTGTATLTLHVVQGRPEVFTLGLVGEGDVVGVVGPGLRDWSVRQGGASAAGRRFLDLHPVAQAGPEGPRDFEFVVQFKRSDLSIPGRVGMLAITGGDAVGFEWRGRFRPDASIDLRLVRADGVLAVENDQNDRALEFVGRGEPVVSFALLQRGAMPADLEVANARLNGKIDESTRSAEFHLHAEARVARAGARVRILAGAAGLIGPTEGDGWHTELTQDDAGWGYDLVGERKGVVPIDLVFTAAIQERDDWRRLDFRLMAGSVVPLSVVGLADGVEFDRAAAVVPDRVAAEWRGFLPADGHAMVGWKRTRQKSEGALFFTSTEQTDVRVGAGLLREWSRLDFRVMQGKLDAVRVRVDGPGEIVGVDGTNVVGWSVQPKTGGERVIEVRLSRPFETEGTLVVQSQSVLGGFPVRAEPLRLTPEGGVRHSGFVRVANAGAVRLEVTDVDGLMQLAPAQYPGPALEAGVRQVFVYRFPAGARRFAVQASQILPDVGVSEVTTYTVGETDRVIQADLELDVREAPLRDWSLLIPADYAVVSVQGSAVSDYNVENGSASGRRALKIFFAQPVMGRQLIQLRLEKNQAAAAGEWRLPALQFPGVKSLRGHIGAIAVPGYRLVPAGVEKLVEVPLSYFPKQVTGLQQAYRLREADWSAALRIEAMGQSVQADVFHLYSIQDGSVSASVLINYFVVGAPASEWRVAVPADAGNIDVIGQGVRREWRREGNIVIVALHQPVLGAATLLVTFEEPLSARGGTIHPGEVTPLAVHTERGYVEVVSPLQVKTTVQQSEGGLLKLEPLELPTELRLFTTAPSLAVYQYTARPFALALGVQRYQPGETVDQVIDFAQFSSQIARDGQVVTEARLFVKTRGRKLLRFQLPANVNLWETRVDDELVTARKDGAWTLVPLSARLNPNEPVRVALRLGQSSGGSSREVTLVAPKLAMPMVIGEWTLRADPGRLLVPQGGTAEVTQSNLTERGFEWVAVRAPVSTVLILIAAALGLWVMRTRSGLGAFYALLAGGFALFVSLALVSDAAMDRRVNRLAVVCAATVVPAENAMTIRVGNLPAWQAMISGWGVAAGLAGLGCWMLGGRYGRTNRDAQRAMNAAGVMLFAIGLLAQRGGAVLFFGALAAALLWFLILPGIRLAWTVWLGRRRSGTAGAAGAASATVSVILLMVIVGGAIVPAPVARAAGVNEVTAGGEGSVQELVQRWNIHDGRLSGEIDVVVRGRIGDSFLLLKAPAVLTSFSGGGLRVATVEHEGAAAYFVTPSAESSGVAGLSPLATFKAQMTFELPVPDLSQGVPILTGPAAAQRLTVQLDQPGWQFASPQAVAILPATGLGADRSGATLILGPEGAPVVNLTPQRRDVDAEAVRYFAEVSNLYMPGPGVVNAMARVGIRPIQGRITSIDVRVPEGFSVGDVGNGPVGRWRFDPVKRLLHLAIEPAQTAAFAVAVQMQQGAGALPFDLTLKPVRVVGAEGDVGAMGLAFGGDAQPEQVQATAVSAVSTDDFDRNLLPRGRDQQPLAVLQAVYRYNRDDAAVSLRVAPVAPEVRAVTRQLISLGDDRVVLAADLAVTITRVGLFQLSFALPAGLEIESASGAALSHWTEAEADGHRIITLHLNGRTLGEQTLALTLSGPAPTGVAAWNVPQVRLREATRQTGELQIVPDRGMRLRALERHNVSELDPRAIGNARPGALAFRLLEEDWTLTLGIETLDPWVTVQALQEVTAREGQTLTRLALHYRVENAAVKQLRVALPGITEDQTRTIRATGPAVSDFVPVPGAPGQWAIRLQRGIIGETAVQIEYQSSAAGGDGTQLVTPPEFEGVRQITQFVAVRGGGRLELEAPVLPHGWQRVDWSAVPVALQDRADRSVPALTFRVAEPERPLSVIVRRHAVADALKLRVTGGSLTTIFSPTGPTLTSADLRIDVAEKSTLRVRLPPGAQLFNAVVNGESVAVVREDDAYLFHVVANTTGDSSAKVRLVYAVSAAQSGRIALLGPRFNSPLENVTWRVVVPPGYDLAGYRGGLQLREERGGGWFGVKDYETTIVSKRAADARQGTEFLQTASALLQSGQQQKAGEILMRAAKTAGLDEASNEDARVQLRALRTEQTVLGLNTRRQRLYLDNSAAAMRNEQLEQAANLNPLMRGKLDFDPQQLDQMLMGNTVEENAALRGIADRIVDQQLAAEPAPQAIDVTLPERGRVYTFGRSLQVDGDAPLELTLSVGSAQRNGIGFGLVVVLGLAAIGVFIGQRKQPAA